MLKDSSQTKKLKRESIKKKQESGKNLSYLANKNKVSPAKQEQKSMFKTKNSLNGDEEIKRIGTTGTRFY